MRDLGQPTQRVIFDLDLLLRQSRRYVRKERYSERNALFHADFPGKAFAPDAFSGRWSRRYGSDEEGDM